MLRWLRSRVGLKALPRRTALMDRSTAIGPTHGYDNLSLTCWNFRWSSSWRALLSNP